MQNTSKGTVTKYNGPDFFPHLSGYGIAWWGRGREMVQFLSFWIVKGKEARLRKSRVLQDIKF